MNRLFPWQHPLALLAIGLLLGCLSAAPSAAQTTSSQSPTLSAVLTDVISLTASVTSVQLGFRTANDYNAGVTTTATNQLNVTSNKPYTLSVKASGDLSNGAATPITIPVSSVGITANWAGGATGSVSSITTSTQALNAAAAATQSQNISVTYSVSSTNAANFLRPSGTYTTTLTYTATQN